MQISEFHQDNKLPINANKLINNVNILKEKFSIFHPVSSYDNDESLSETYKKTIEIAQLSEDLGFEGIFLMKGWLIILIIKVQFKNSYFSYLTTYK